MIDLLGTLGGFAMGVVLLVGVLFGFIFPWLAFSAVRSLRIIRMQFERLNESLDARASEARGGPFGH